MNAVDYPHRVRHNAPALVDNQLEHYSPSDARTEE
jgi:hypothetical protein